MDGVGHESSSFVHVKHFGLDGCSIVETRVAPTRAVSAFDELEDGHAGGGLRLEATLLDELALESREEALAIEAFTRSRTSDRLAYLAESREELRIVVAVLLVKGLRRGDGRPVQRRHLI